MKKYNIPLTVKSSLLVVFTFFFIILFFYISFESNKEYLLKHELEYLRAITDARAEELLMFMDSKRKRIGDVARDGFVIDETRKTVRGGKNGSALSHYLVNLKMPNFEHIYRVSILSLDGRVIASTTGLLIGEDESKEEYVTNALKNIPVTEKDNGFMGEPEVAFTGLIYDAKTGRPVGIAAGFVLVSELEQAFKGEFGKGLLEVRGKRTGLEALEVVIVNKDKLLLSRSPLVKDSVLKQKADTLPVRSCLEKSEEKTGLWSDYRGIEVAGASVCLPSLKWTLVYKVDRKAIFEPSSRIGRETLIAVVGAIILMGALATFFMRLVVLQLRRVSKASSEIAGGNYDVVLPVESRDEVGVLSESFNEMAKKIKERTHELAESESRYRTLIESLQEGIWVIDAEDRTTYVNPKMAEMLGYTVPEMMGRHVFSFVDEKSIDETKKRLKRRRKGLSEIFELEFMKKNGLRIYVRLAATPLIENGRYVGSLAGVIDITERKMAEEEVVRLNKELEARVEARTIELQKAVADLAAANREIETFTYSVAHDLKNPLRLIDGFSRILLKKHLELLDSDGQDNLLRITEAARRMGQLIDDLLDLSFVMRAELNLVPVEISSMAASIASDLQTADPDRTAEFRIEPGLRALGDKKLVRMVLENLIGNSWKFTSKKAEQTIEFGSAGPRDGREVFFIKDNGAGFDMKDADRLFEPFQRLHSAEEYPGTGIGLATVRRIIQRHGGDVWAEGRPGMEAVFYFTLAREG